MIVVKCNKNEFAYDVHSLVKAFYPAEDVKVFEEGEKSLSSDFNLPELFMYFEENKIEAVISVDGEEKCRRDAIMEGTLTRPQYKNELKHLLYGILSEFTGKELPWGNLTGIRPTKIPYAMLEEGKEQEEIVAYMKEMYSCSDKKALLAYDIAKREREILSKIHYDKGYSLEEIFEMNIDKLRERYPDGFSVERSVDRDEDDI